MFYGGLEKKKVFVLMQRMLVELWNINCWQNEKKAIIGYQYQLKKYTVCIPKNN